MKKITDTIQEFDPPIPGKLENGTWMHWKIFPFLEEIISLYLLKRGSRWSGWFTTEVTSCTNGSVNFLNVDKNYRVNERQRRRNYLYTYHWKQLLQWLYPYITWFSKNIYILKLDTKVKWFRGDSTEHNIKNYLFNPTLMYKKDRKR